MLEGTVGSWRLVLVGITSGGYGEQEGGRKASEWAGSSQTSARSSGSRSHSVGHHFDIKEKGYNAVIIHIDLLKSKVAA